MEETNKDNKILRLIHLKKAFDGHEVLKDINLDVQKGETVTVLGKSGTGKSVVLKCIVGLILPDSGQTLVFGKDIKDLNENELQEVRKKVGFLFQSAALYDSMSVKQNLSFPLIKHSDLSEEELDHKIKEALENVDLKSAIDKMPSELSGGMRKRLGLARTLILSPEIMLYDEPTTGLDPVTSRDISYLMKEMQEKYKMTSFVVTHDMPCAKIVSDRIVVLRDGKYIAEGNYEELENSKDDFVRAFFQV